MKEPPFFLYTSYMDFIIDFIMDWLILVAWFAFNMLIVISWIILQAKGKILFPDLVPMDLILLILLINWLIFYFL